MSFAPSKEEQQRAALDAQAEGRGITTMEGAKGSMGNREPGDVSEGAGRMANSDAARAARRADDEVPHTATGATQILPGAASSNLEHQLQGSPRLPHGRGYHRPA
eukprot:tig00001222_g7607.t1